MNPEALIPALVVLPMLGFLVTAVVGRRLGKQAHWVPVIAIFAVWVAAMMLVVNVLSGAAPLLPGSEDSHGNGSGHAHPALRRKWSACTPDSNRRVDRSSRCRGLDRPWNNVGPRPLMTG